MHRHVIVAFGKDKEVDYKIPAAEVAAQSAAQAQQWFAQEFEALECDVATPIGKVLRSDLVLSVAKYAGERRFRDDPDWARRFATNAASLLDRNVIRVDLGNYTVGY